MVGLGGCPVAVTVYPPGRGCLHSASLTQSPGCVEYSSAKRQLGRVERFTPAKHRLPLTKTERLNRYRTEWQLGRISATTGLPWRYVCFNPPPPQREKKKRKPSAEEYNLCVSRTPPLREGRNGSLLKERTHCCRKPVIL